MMIVFEEVLLGFRYFCEGVSLLCHPQLRRFVLLPLLMNILFFAGLCLVLIHYYANISLFLMMHLPSWLSVVAILAKVAVFFLYLLIMLYSFFTVATIIAAPFNGLLAEKAALLFGALPVEKTWGALLCDTPRLVGRQLMIVLLYTPISLLLSILLLVPILHTLIFILWVWFHARMIALIYLDYPTDNAGISLRALRAWMRQHKALVFGFGSAVLFTSSIPVVNFFVIPASVIAATKLWVERGSVRVG